MENQFTTVAWAAGANIYEVNTRQYTIEGTFNAFEKHLPRLHDMGVKILWFMPITPIGLDKRIGTLGSYYACSNYTAINPEFGTLDDFKRIVDTAHSLGLKILIDWVANHTAYDHIWRQSNPEFYKKDYNGNFFDAHGWVDVIDLDYDSTALRTAMIEAMRFWITECHIDGFRCDMAHLVPLDFWRTARQQLETIKPLFWLAECEVPEYHQVFDATYSWELLHKMEALYKKEVTLTALDGVLTKYGLEFPKDAIRLFFTSNHDEDSHSGNEYERLGDGANAFTVLAATWASGMLMVYSGQELPNKKRLLFFDKDHIDWSEQPKLHKFYKTLLELNASHAAIQINDKKSITERINTSAEGNIFAFVRSRGEEQLLVLINLTPATKLKFTISTNMITGIYESVFSGFKFDLTEERLFELQAWEYLVYKRVA